MGEKTILLIDDDELVLKLLNINLRPRGFSVVEFLGGEGAYEKAQEIKPSLIIPDIMMPLMDGWAVLEKLRGGGATSDIPVIILSVKGSQDVVRRTRDMGATYYMAKPFDPKELISKVIEIIGIP